MELKFKVGDLIVSKNRKPDTQILVMRIFEIDPPEFRNMYAIGRADSNIATTFKNYDVVHRNCELASPAIQVLYGSKTK